MAGCKRLVDRNYCVGAGNCVVCAVTAFEIDLENEVLILGPSSVERMLSARQLEAAAKRLSLSSMVKGRWLYP